MADPEVGQATCGLLPAQGLGHPRLEWPTMLQTHLTPQFTMVSAITSLPVRAWAASCGKPT